jgi:hypothetical protein
MLVCTNLECVVDEVVQYLLESLRVCNDGDGQPRVHLHVPSQCAGPRIVWWQRRQSSLHRVADILDDPINATRCKVEFEAAGIHLATQQQIIEQAHHGMTAVQYGIDAFALVARQPTGRQQIGHRQDAIHGLKKNRNKCTKRTIV